MSTSDDIAIRFQQHKHRVAHERQKAKELKAQADTIKSNTNAEARRIDAGLPHPHACPDCWVGAGDTSLVVARTANRSPANSIDGRAPGVAISSTFRRDKMDIQQPFV